MKNQFQAIFEDVMTEQNSNYHAKVDLYVHMNKQEDEDYNSAYKVQVEFSMEIDARSWGIKGITVVPHRIEAITVELTKADGSVSRTLNLQIDASKLRQEVSAPERYVGVGDVNIAVGPDGNVDYGSSSIEIYGF